MPVEETENFFRVRVREPGEFDPDTFRTITLSEDAGILSVIGVLKETGKWDNQNFMFEKAKGWTADSASTWVTDHGYTIKILEEAAMATNQANVTVDITVDDVERVAREILERGSEPTLIIGEGVAKAIQRLKAEAREKIAETKEITRSHRSYVAKINAKEHKVMDVVYAPMVPDSYDEFMTAGEIRKMADWFMKNHPGTGIDEMHDYRPGVANVTQSFIARANDPDGFPEDSWVIEVQVTDKKVWKRIVKGDYKAFSFSGSAELGKTQTLDSPWADDDGNFVNPYSEEES